MARMPLIPALFVSILLTLPAAAQAEVGNPPWQTATAPAGSHAVLHVRVAGIPPGETTATVTLGQAAPLEARVLEQYGELQVRVPPQDEPLVFSDWTVTFRDGTRHTVTMPTEVRWLPAAENGPLLRASTLLTGDPSALALLIENGSSGPVALTALHYAPRAVSTGRLAVLRDPPAGSEPLDLDIPYFDARSAFEPTAWEGLPFEAFSFREDSITLGPGGQVLLALGAEGFSGPHLFNVTALFNLNILIDWEDAEKTQTQLLFSQSHRPRPW